VWLVTLHDLYRVVRYNQHAWRIQAPVEPISLFLLGTIGVDLKVEEPRTF
jgi:hypothetical protein